MNLNAQDAFYPHPSYVVGCSSKFD